MYQNLISVQQLAQKMASPDIIVLDASMQAPLPGVSNVVHQAFIPGSAIFDIENVFIDGHGEFPHTMPSCTEFQHHARALGLENDAEIVVYDNMGLYSSPRVWWMLKAMGASNVKVLNGGLPAWQAAHMETIDAIETPKPGGFLASYDEQFFITAQDILAGLAHKQYKVLDARSPGRFYGTEPEPRAGVRRGHIPGAQCLHFRTVTDSGFLKPIEVLKHLFAARHIDSSDSLIFTCGSGITACILALAATEAGFQLLRVFDGSWAEWGSNMALPISVSE